MFRTSLIHLPMDEYYVRYSYLIFEKSKNKFFLSTSCIQLSIFHISTFTSLTGLVMPRKNMHNKYNEESKNIRGRSHKQHSRKFLKS